MPWFSRFSNFAKKKIKRIRQRIIIFLIIITLVPSVLFTSMAGVTIMAVISFVAVYSDKFGQDTAEQTNESAKMRCACGRHLKSGYAFLSIGLNTPEAEAYDLLMAVLDYIAETSDGIRLEPGAVGAMIALEETPWIFTKTELMTIDGVKL